MHDIEIIKLLENLVEEKEGLDLMIKHNMLDFLKRSKEHSDLLYNASSNSQMGSPIYQEDEFTKRKKEIAEECKARFGHNKPVEGPLYREDEFTKRKKEIAEECKRLFGLN